MKGIFKRIIACAAAFAMIFSLIEPSAVSAAQCSYGNPYTNTASKKGIMIHNGMLSDVEDLGVSEASFSVPLSHFISNSQTAYSYQYKGKTYYFQSIVSDYDVVVKKLSDAGVNISVAFINPYADGYEYLIYPGVGRHDGTYYYGINTATEEGKNAVEAACHFFAERYNGGKYGIVSNYIVGNEVNDNGAYNYVGDMGLDEYVSVYYQTFKTMYDALKAENSNANIYVPLEQRWTTENTSTDYAGKDFLERFDTLSKNDGNIDWNLAFHAYSYPLINTNVLMDNAPQVDGEGKAVQPGAVTDSVYTKIITMKNIDVLTDYMSGSNMLKKDGNVRSIILSEQGYTSSTPQGGVDEKLQAASIAYAYYKAEMNPYIDAFILNGQLDSTKENDYMKFGIWNGVWDGNAGEFYPTSHKYAYDMYKYIDTDKSLEVTEFALKALGLTSWSAAIKNFDAGKFNKTVTNGSIYSIESTSNVRGASVISKGIINGSTSAAEPTENESFWKLGYNMHGISIYSHDKDNVSGTGRYYPLGTLVADGNCLYSSYQTVYHDFDTPLDLSDAPYLGFTAQMIPHYSGNDSDKMVLRVRVYSGTNIYDANCLITANESNTVYVDLSDWAYKNSIDRVSVWVKENSTQESFDGVFTIYNLTKAAGLIDAKTMPMAVNTTQNDSSVNVPDSVFNPTLYGTRDYSAVYDPNYYYNKYADVRGSVGDSPALLLTHFVTQGMSQGRQGIADFDVNIYKNNYSDLSNAFGNNLPMYYEHYIILGKDEGRTGAEVIEKEDTDDDFVETDPDEPYIYNGVDYTAVFNEEYYKRYNTDVVEALGSDRETLLSHFVNYGMSEGRQASKKFDVKVYRAYNKDVVEAFGYDNVACCMHYINYGKAEGRKASGKLPEGYTEDNQNNNQNNNQGGNQNNQGGNGSSIPAGSYVVNGVDYSSVFNADFYYNNNSDVAAVFGQDANALFAHFMNYGLSEGRQASSEFSITVYKASNSDLVSAFGDNNIAYLNHYINYGKAEGRRATGEVQNPSQNPNQGGTAEGGVDYSAVFDAQFYYEHNSDVAAAFGNDANLLYSHFVNYGMGEGRAASSEFNVKVYKECNADIAAAYGDDLAAYYTHYVKYGKAEGRRCK